MTQCSTDAIKFKALGKRSVVADFNGGTITSDAGALLLDQTERAIELLRRAADCFTDHRDGDLVEHTVEHLIRQRVFALALGYEDLNDHDELSRDPLLAAVVGKCEPTGQARRSRRDRDRPLAGKSTLNRLELTAEDAGPARRYKKTVLDFEAMRSLFVDVFLEAYDTPPAQIIIDLDATDDPLHGKQEGRFFHGYYKSYCYLPLYAFCGEHLLAAELRPSNIDASCGTVELMEQLVSSIRDRWPDTRIILRADSGFTRDPIMAWCEANDVDYVLGLAGTTMARSRCDTIRLKLLKIGASVRVSVRRVVVALAGGYTLKQLFHQILHRLEAAIANRVFRPRRC